MVGRGDLGRPAASGSDATRYPRRWSPAAAGRCGAERDKRAGDRATRAWARDNATDLRQLAGQISALNDLPLSANSDLAAVRRALGGNDVADLLGPLVNARPHLEAGHPALAAEVRAVDRRTSQLRRDTHLSRHPTD